MGAAEAARSIISKHGRVGGRCMEGGRLVARAAHEPTAHTMFPKKGGTWMGGKVVRVALKGVLVGG